jgi:hypothetical protein
MLQGEGACSGSATATTTGTTVGGITTTSGTTGTTIGGITTTTSGTTGTTIGGITTTSGTTGTTIGGTTTTGTTGAATTSGTTTGTTTSTCSATAAGGIALTSNYLPASAMIGMGGYAYSYMDTGGSTACLDSTSFCGMGSSVMQNPPTYSFYGGGIGVNLNQAMGAGTAMMTFTPTGTGVTYALSNLPAGARVIIDNAGADYCANLTSASGTVPWSMFTPMCYNAAGMQGTALAAAPSATHVEFQVPSGMAVESWNFCVTTLTL